MIYIAIAANIILGLLGLLLGLAGVFRWWLDEHGPPDEEA